MQDAEKQSSTVAQNWSERLKYWGRRFPPLKWIGWLLYPFWWLITTVFAFVRSGWRATQPNRKRQRRRWRSWLSVRRAKFRAWARRRKPPVNAHIAKAPPKPAASETEPAKGFSRFVAFTALASVSVLALAILYLVRFRPPETIIELITPEVVAAVQEAGTATVTPAPSPTVPPTPTATPTPVIIELSPWPTPDPLAGGGSLVFELHKGGNSDLYALAIGRQNPIRLTNDPAADLDPVWSPSGREIAFTSRRFGNFDIFILDMQSGEVAQITSQQGYDGKPAWSPDGQWLVYESYQGENLDIYIVRKDLSQGPIRLTENIEPDIAPVWSPDGRSIAYSSMRQGNMDIWAMSLDAVGDSQAINLTQSADFDESNPAFAPDGQLLAWGGQSKIDSTQQVFLGQISDISLQDIRPIGTGEHPTWSPASDTLAWEQDNAFEHLLLVGSINQFGVVPQSFVVDGEPRGPHWSGVPLTDEPAGWLVEMANSPVLALYEETVTVNNPAAEENEDAETEEGVAADVSGELPTAPPRQLRRVLNDGELPLLSDGVDQSFLALRGRIEAETGIDLLADTERMFVPLNAASQPGESDEIWHKAGRAFDINSELALSFSPIIEVVRRDSSDQTYWEVFVKTAAQDGSQGQPMTEIPWDFRARFGDNPVDYDQGGRLKDGIPAGYYVSLTELAQDYGWEPVPADRNWRTFYPGVRFWQFEKRDGLTWEQAMLELYGPEQLEN